MGWSWARISVVAIALVALAGCCPDPDEPAPGDDGRLRCKMDPSTSYRVTIEGTAQYTTEVTGDAVVEGISYSTGGNSLWVDSPQQPFSATVELEVGEYFGSYLHGTVLNGSILVRDKFTPADGSASTAYELTCGTER